MAKTERNSQIRRDRRTIIAALRMVYPGWMPGEELYRIVLDQNPEYTRTLGVRDLTYLNEKNYVGYKGERGLDATTVAVKGCLFRLTAKGTEVAYQLVDDPTLEL